MSTINFVKLFTTLLALFACERSGAAIFGIDNRKALCAGSHQYESGRATAIAVLSSMMTQNPDHTLDLDTQPLTDFVCKDQRFSSDPSLSYACSGFLVAPDLLVTAGHCMVNTGEVRDESHGYCEIYSWLFDYHDGHDPAQTKNISNAHLYGCRRILYAINEEQAPYRDFAVVQLDRPVTDRKPLKLRQNATHPQAPFTLIGYPFGTPLKIADQGQLLKNDLSSAYFQTDLDAQSGNSGSPVLDVQNEVVGVLIGGTPTSDFAAKAGQTCSQYNRCDAHGLHCLNSDLTTAAGTDVFKIDPVVRFLSAH